MANFPTALAVIDKWDYLIPLAGMGVSACFILFLVALLVRALIRDAAREEGPKDKRGQACRPRG